MTRLPWPAPGVKDWKNSEVARGFEVTDALFDAVYAVAEPMLKDAMDSATGNLRPRARVTRRERMRKLRRAARRGVTKSCR